MVLRLRFLAFYDTRGLTWNVKNFLKSREIADPTHCACSSSGSGDIREKQKVENQGGCVFLLSTVSSKVRLNRI